MDHKSRMNTGVDLRKTYYNSLKQQHCALNMQIRLAMETYDMDTKALLEKELEGINQELNLFRPYLSEQQPN